MQRAKLLFEGQGFQVLPASVGEGVTPTEYKLNMMHFIPQAGAMAKKYAIVKRMARLLKREIIPPMFIHKLSRFFISS